METLPIHPVDRALAPEIKRALDNKTKPVDSLGRLESYGAKIALIQKSTTPRLISETIVLFAGDHGITQEKVSAYPSEVTRQMVYNFMEGGAAINGFCKTGDIRLLLVDSGVRGDPFPPPVLNRKIGPGTKSFLNSPAMDDNEYRKAVAAGSQIIDDLVAKGVNTVGFGEMGIGNSSAAAIITSEILDLPIAAVTCRGTGLSDDELACKISILEESKKKHGLICDSHGLLQTYGGYEMAMMCGAMLQACAQGLTVVVDGFICSAVALCCYKMDPNCRDYFILSHASKSKGYKHIAAALDLTPVLDLEMGLGEGTGAALCLPILRSACSILTHMASFEQAGLSGRHK